MLSRSESKYIQSLYHKKQRDVEGLFIVEGPKLAEELLNSEFAIKKIYALESWVYENEIKIPIVVVSEVELQKISNLQTANQVLMIVEQQKKIKNIKSKIKIVLDGLQDPGNMGTIIRIADWFGIKEIICSFDTVELYNPKVIQSTMGSFIRVEVSYCDLQEYLQENKIPVYGAILNGTNIKQIKKPKEALIVIGNESKGIRENILPFIQNKISIAP